MYSCHMAETSINASDLDRGAVGAHDATGEATSELPGPIANLVDQTRGGVGQLTLSPSSIAVLAGVRRSTVSSWRSPARNRGFPAAVAGTTSRPLFSGADVATWLKANDLWPGDEVFLGRMPEVVLSQLADALGVSPRVSWDVGAKFLETACLFKMAMASGVEFRRLSVAELRSCGRKVAASRPAWLELLDPDDLGDSWDETAGVGAQSSETGVLIDLMNEMLRIFSDRLAEWSQRIVRALMTRNEFQETGPRGEGTSTDRDQSGVDDEPIAMIPRLEALIAALQRQEARGDEAEDLVVVDLSVGMGDSLISLCGSESDGIWYLGVEGDERQYLAARRRAFIVDAPLEIHNVDILAEDLPTNLQADLIIADARSAALRNSNFDYGSRIRPHDSRWTLGIPQGEMAWAMIAMAHLAPHGLALIATSDGGHVNDQDETILRRMVSRGWVQEMKRIGDGRTYWTVAREPAASTISVSFLGKSRKVPIEWIQANPQSDVRTLLVEYATVDLPAMRSALKSAKSGYERAAGRLVDALGTAGATLIGQLPDRTDQPGPPSSPGSPRQVNRMTVSDMADAGFLRIVTGRKRPSPTETHADVVVDLDAGVVASLAGVGVELAPRGFVLRVLRPDDLDPGYLAVALMGPRNQKLRDDQRKPRLIDRLKSFEVPILPPAKQRALAEAITRIRNVRELSTSLASYADDLEGSLLQSAWYGAIE